MPRKSSAACTRRARNRGGVEAAVAGAPAEDAGRMVVVYDHGRALAELIVTYKVVRASVRQNHPPVEL